MTYSNEPDVNHNVVERAMRHISHHGGTNEDWFVGIEEEASDRDDTADNYPVHYKMKSEDEAKLTMSWLLGLGLMADDEYGAEPTVLFVYSDKEFDDE